MVKVQKRDSKFILKGISEKTNSTKIKKSKVKPLKEKTKLVQQASTANSMVKKNNTANKVSKINKEKDNFKNKNFEKQDKIKKDFDDKKPLKEGKKETNNIQPSLKFEQFSFDEKLFKNVVKLENIQNIVEALKKIVEKEITEKKTSIFTDYTYFLNVASYKIPNCPKRMVKLNVKHSLVDANTDDVVIIVPDLQRGRKVDYEPTIQHYEDLLQKNGITGIRVIPFNQLRNECTTFEAKRKFANSYDYFLCDGRIVGHAVGFCGKNSQRPRSTLHAVHLNNSKTYKSSIENALKRTCYRQIEKGNLISIPVGNHRFTPNQLADNIEMVINQLETIFPGGYANIRNIYVKIDIKGTSSLPLYVSLAGAPAETPNVVGPREQRMLKLKKQANEILSKFSLSKSGDFVKLSKFQVERKQQIRVDREELLSKEKNTELSPPSKKIKNYSKTIKQVQARNNSGKEIENVGQDEVVDDDGEVDDDDAEGEVGNEDQDDDEDDDGIDN